MLASQPQEQQSSIPILSSFGVLDERLRERYGEVKVLDLWWGSDMLTGEATVHLWSWRGRIVLNACWCETYFEEGVIRRFLEVLKEELMRGLGIEC
jgi:hypothetical protein